MNSTQFATLYKKLNSEQKRAVDAIEGPVIVIAGPGTGKTSILTLRIANILQKTDTMPESILALTFTESGVHSVRKKLVEIMGPTGYRVAIYTFHSFCNEVIKNFPQEFPRIIGAQHVTDIDQINILEDIILNTKLEVLKPSGDPFFYIKPVLGFIKELKREDVSPEEYVAYLKKFEARLNKTEDLVHEKGAYKGEIKAKYKPVFRKIENGKEFATVYEKYQKALAEKRLYDYEDMIVEVLRELRENKDLLLELQETYQYILADEHQDANRGQNRLLELLSGFHEQPNLFVVGDEKQAIFRFQGASLENFLYFKKKFPEALVVSLKKNYRSTQGILDASHSLIEKNPSGGAERIRLESNDTKKNPDINVTECASPQAEVEYIAENISQKIESGIQPEHIAILFRDNRDADLVSRVFDQKNISYVLHTDVDVIGDDYIKRLLFILKAINDFGNNELLLPVLFIDFFKLSHLDVFKVVNHSRTCRRGIIDIIKSREKLVEADVDNPESFIELYRMLHELSVIAKNESLAVSFQEIVSRIGYVGFLLSKPRAFDLVASYEVLLRHITELLERHKDIKLNDYLILLEKMNVHGVSVKARGVGTYPGKVNIMTAHKSKGLEFDYVYCLHLNEGRWGGRKAPSYFLPIGVETSEDLENDLSDERRLLYVVLTRARKEINMTYATQNTAGRELLPSQFIGEIDPALVQCGTYKDEPLHLQEKKKKELVSTKISIKDKEYISNLFLERGFSVSELNNYLTCPWRYFFLNLLRIPKIEERHQLFGTAIHETLKAFFDAYKLDKEMSKNEMLDYFENALNRKALSAHDFELFLQRGKKSLGGYYDAYKGTWPKNILTEFHVSGVSLPLKLESGTEVDILLRGQLDKVEFLTDSTVNVVDYKTGTPKSRNDIEGETKSSDGNYKRQLVFYKLILSRHEKLHYVMKTGEIDFVEPNKQGKYKKEKFDIADADVMELVEVIKKTATEIIAQDFWDKECNETECEFCALKRFLVD